MTLRAIRFVAGVVFVVFGAGKFVDHAGEAASFAAYGLPWPDAFTDAVGVVEIAGGVALIAGVALAPVALVLAADMVGAIVISGLLRWEWISLTLAPVLLAGMLVLLRDQRSSRSISSTSSR